MVTNSTNEKNPIIPVVRELFLPEYFGKCEDKNQILYLLNFHSFSVQMYFICVMVSYFSCVYFHCPSHPLDAFLAYITWLFLFLSVSNKDVVILKSQYVHIVSVQKNNLDWFFLWQFLNHKLFAISDIKCFGCRPKL